MLDSGYKWELTDEEAYDLGRRAIYHATYRDAYSGGIVRGKVKQLSTYYLIYIPFFLIKKKSFSFSVYHLKSTGWVHISNNDCKDLHYNLADAKEKK